MRLMHGPGVLADRQQIECRSTTMTDVDRASLGRQHLTALQFGGADHGAGTGGGLTTGRDGQCKAAKEGCFVNVHRGKTSLARARWESSTGFGRFSYNGRFQPYWEVVQR